MSKESGLQNVQHLHCGQERSALLLCPLIPLELNTIGRLVLPQNGATNLLKSTVKQRARLICAALINYVSGLIVNVRRDPVT